VSGQGSSGTVATYHLSVIPLTPLTQSGASLQAISLGVSKITTVKRQYRTVTQVHVDDTSPLQTSQGRRTYLLESTFRFSSSIASSSGSVIPRWLQTDLQLISDLAIFAKWMSLIFWSNSSRFWGGMVASIWSREAWVGGSIVVTAAYPEPRPIFYWGYPVRVQDLSPHKTHANKRCRSSRGHTRKRVWPRDY